MYQLWWSTPTTRCRPRSALGYPGRLRELKTTHSEQLQLQIPSSQISVCFSYPFLLDFQSAESLDSKCREPRLATATPHIPSRNRPDISVRCRPSASCCKVCRCRRSIGRLDMLRPGCLRSGKV